MHESTTPAAPSRIRLNDLAESIRQHGFMPPITLRPHNEELEIVAGAKRLSAPPHNLEQITKRRATS
ncbi:MAG: ParB/RepB/Spo0J family partition protein [Janthinobacterium lividum]